MSVNTTSTWVANNTLPSAFIGQPPNTQRDWYIVRGFLRLVGLSDTDPALGYVLAAKDNGANDGSKRPAVIGGLITCLVAISTVTIARLGLRASMSQMRFGLDDWATIAAAIMGLTYEDYNTFNYYGTLDKLIFYVTVALVKTSLTLFIRRLADRASKMWRWFCDFFLFTLAVYILAATFWFCFTCDPPRAQWDRLYAGQLETPATCLSTVEWGIIFNVTHVVQGCILLLSPIVILWKVTMEIKKKIRLFAIWACGLLAVLFGLMRMLRANFTADIMWSYTELLIWTTLDVSVGIVVISLPVLDAWIASGARKAMTKLGRTRGTGMSKSGYGNLDKSSGYASARTAKSMGTRNTSHETSQDGGESEDGIIDRKDSPMELTIMRTDEYAVRFSAVDEEEARRFGGQASVTPGVGKDKFTGIAR